MRNQTSGGDGHGGMQMHSTPGEWPDVRAHASRDTDVPPSVSLAAEPITPL